MCLIFRGEVVGSEVDEIKCTEPFDPHVVHEPCHGGKCNASEEIGSNNAPTQGWFLLVLREM